MKKLILILLLAAALFAACFVLLPFGPHSETFVDIPVGTSTAGIATRLENARIIRSRSLFELERLLQGGTLKAGEYRFASPASVREVYARIRRGDVYTVTLTIPEGFNLFDIAQVVQADHFATASNFLHAAQNETALIRDLDPHAPSLEGYLFPDTYKLSRHATADQILRAMVLRFRKAVAPLGIRPSAVPRTVILASLIEKEVASADERPTVAGVFENRLAAGMPLQTDPSVVYAALLAGRWRGTIHQSDLAYDSRYNTYRFSGLPPGPIANPGLPSLEAALHPGRTDAFYFVADGHGHTRFSTSLKEHQQQVAGYRDTQQPSSPPVSPKAPVRRKYGLHEP